MEINTVEYKPENPQLVIAEYEYCPENDSEVLKNKKTIKEYSSLLVLESVDGEKKISRINPEII